MEKDGFPNSEEDFAPLNELKRANIYFVSTIKSPFNGTENLAQNQIRFKSTETNQQGESTIETYPNI